MAYPTINADENAFAEQANEYAGRQYEDTKGQIADRLTKDIGYRPGETLASSGGANDDRFLSALRKRAAQDLPRAEQNIRDQADVYAVRRRFEKLSKAKGLLQKEQQYNRQVLQLKREAEQAKRAARSQVLGQLLGVAGAIAGFAAGGPSGAMVGYGAGNAAGQGMGGATNG